jgi:transposase
MLSLSELVRIYVCLTPTDMRKSFDSLAAVVREGLGYDPLSGHLFVFRSRRGDRVKLLWWDRDGLTSYYRERSPVPCRASRLPGPWGPRRPERQG